MAQQTPLFPLIASRGIEKHITGGGYVRRRCASRAPMAQSAGIGVGALRGSALHSRAPRLARPPPPVRRDHESGPTAVVWLVGVGSDVAVAATTRSP